MQVNPVGTTPQPKEILPLGRSLDPLQHKSFITTLGKPLPFSEIFSAVFRIFTFFIHFLFVRTPKLNGFYIPDLTAEKKAEYKEYFGGILPDWNLDPRGRKGPSYQQKIQLLHQYMSFEKHIREWEKAKNGTVTGSATLYINGKKIELIDEAVWKFYLEAISNPEHYERGKDATITFTFKSKCVFDHGFGPYRVKTSTLTCKNTVGCDGKSLTIQETNKKMRSRYSFFRSSAMAPFN